MLYISVQSDKTLKLHLQDTLITVVNTNDDLCGVIEIMVNYSVGKLVTAENILRLQYVKTSFK